MTTNFKNTAWWWQLTKLGWAVPYCVFGKNISFEKTYCSTSRSFFVSNWFCQKL